MAEKVNLQKSYSNLNEKLAKVFDESGVKRSFTVPYIDGQEMREHIDAVQQAATKSGGLAANLLATYHHGNGKGWGSGDGHTIGFPAAKLRDTIIPDGDENAKAAIDAAQSHINSVAKLIGDDNPAVKTANSQLALVKKTDGAGMNLLDFGVMLTQVVYLPNQTVARMHNGTKEGGHSANLRAPRPDSGAGSEGPGTPGAPAPAEGEGAGEGSETTQEGAGEAQAAPQALEGSAGPSAAPAAPAAPAAQG